ncbi:YecA family protein [Marinimicrobium locisalis]|uniref:YecA family protein n=1 Tax=Marinimicrobium locisalis TaxID=546022 RepID=UPI0032219D54
MAKTGRNDPCPCGSGRKYKKCCLPKQAPPVSDLSRQRLRKTEGTLVEPMLAHAKEVYGQNFMIAAWEEFTVGYDWPLSEDTPEVETIFLPWVLYNWEPYNEDLPPEEAPEVTETIAEHYLEHGGRRLDDYTQRFIKAACAQPYSFFVVTDIAPNQSLKLKDLLLGREVTVLERMATEDLNPGDILYSRIVTLDGATVMLGCAPIIIPPSEATNLLAVRDSYTTAYGPLDLETLHLLDPDLRELYGEFRESVFNPVPPELVNTDGDPLTFITLCYELSCTPGEAVEALKTLNTRNGGSEEEVLAEAQYDPAGTLTNAFFRWLRRDSAHHAGLGVTVLGHITIDGNRLEVEVNSYPRATSIKRRIGQRLGRKRARLVEEKEGSLDELGSLEPPHPEEPGSQELMESPEVQQAMAEMSRAHWEQWLDSPLPALEGKTPREAARTAKGRERLELLLLDFEGRAQGDVFAPDVDALREALGLKR